MRFPIFIRRLHLYLGLALLPWFFMYAIGAAVLNHSQLFDRLTRTDKPEWSLRFEREYHRPVPADADLKAVAAEILRDLDLPGSFWVNRPNDRQIQIHAFTFLSGTRVRYFVNEGRVVAEDQAFRWNRFFVGMHERAGFGQGPWLTKAWAAIVDLVGISLVIWVISGLYTWWTSRQQRRAGSLVLAAGVVSFVVLVALL